MFPWKQSRILRAMKERQDFRQYLFLPVIYACFSYSNPKGRVEIMTRNFKEI